MLLYVLLRVYLLSFLFGCYEFVWDVDHHVCITKLYLCLIFRAMLSDMLSCSTLECHSLTYLSSPIEDFFPNNSKWWKTANRVLFPAFVAFKICNFPLIVRNIKRRWCWMWGERTWIYFSQCVILIILVEAILCFFNLNHYLSWTTNIVACQWSYTHVCLNKKTVDGLLKCVQPRWSYRLVCNASF